LDAQESCPETTASIALLPKMIDRDALLEVIWSVSSKTVGVETISNE